MEEKCAGKPMKLKGILDKAKTAGRVAAATGVLGTAAGIGTGTLPGAIAAGRGKRLEGAKEGLKAQVIPLVHPIKMVKAQLHGMVHPIKVADPNDPHSKYVGGFRAAVAAGRRVKRGLPED